MVDLAFEVATIFGCPCGLVAASAAPFEVHVLPREGTLELAGALDFVFDQLLLGKCNAGRKSECGNDVEAHLKFEFYITIESMGTPFKPNSRQILFIFSSLFILN